MKVIDLLIDKANGKELPKKVKYNSIIFEYKDGLYLAKSGMKLIENFMSLDSLNNEIEIIEEPKKIHQLEYYDNAISWCINGREITDNEKDIIDKLNEIIDYINRGDSNE